MDLVSIMKILEGDETDDMTCNTQNVIPDQNNTVEKSQNDSTDSYIILNLDQQIFINSQNNQVPPREPECSSNLEGNFCFIESKNGGQIMLKSGYRYRINRKNKNGTTIWVCTKKNCKATLSLDDKRENVLREKFHTCIPDYRREDFEKILDKCKKDVQKNMKPIPTMYEEAVRDLKDKNYVDHVPKLQSVKNTLYRSRNNFLNVKKTTFKNLEDVIIAPEIGKDFLLVDSGGKDKILIFMLNDVKEELKTMNHFFLDGTFFVTPSPFYQLYSIHADIGSTDDKTLVVPVIFALLPNKTQSTYQKMFQLIKDSIPEFKPASFKIDFETAAINAIKDIFPQSNISGCFFHFNKALWKKGKELGLVDVPNGKKHIAMCAATAHLPTTFTPEAWVSLLESSPEGEEARKFNEYFTTQWMKKNVNIICCYNQRHRTTNPVEGWHNRLNKKLNKRPPLYMLISTLKEEARETRFKIEQEGTYNQEQRQRKKKCMAIDNRINKIVEDLLNQKIDMSKCLKRLSSVKLENK